MFIPDFKKNTGRKYFSNSFKQQMGSASPVVAHQVVCTSLSKHPMGDPEPTVGPTRRCSESRDCITAGLGTRFEKWSDGLNS